MRGVNIYYAVDGVHAFDKTGAGNIHAAGFSRRIESPQQPGTLRIFGRHIGRGHEDHVAHRLFHGFGSVWRLIDRIVAIELLNFFLLVLHGGRLHQLQGR